MSRAARPAMVVALFALALWPSWRWAAARLADGSDDPLGLAALAVLAVAVVRLAPRLLPVPRRPMLALAAALALFSAAASAFGPPLVAALLAAFSLASALRAFMAPATPALALTGLAALALPVVSSLQFYAGFPLRIVTAQASTWLLGAAGFAAEREGSAMRVDGRLVIVDAPCSGVQMVWMAYFCACTAAWWTNLADRAFARRIAGVGVLVLIGNVVRNSVLVGMEARGAAPAFWVHEAVGVTVLAAVCAAVVALVGRASGRGIASVVVDPVWPASPHRTATATWRAPLAVVLLAATAMPWLAVAATGRDVATATAAYRSAIEMPREWNGRPLRPLALDAVEARFASRFPGRIERLTDGRSTLVWRSVNVPTRMLHPGADCYRGLGYRIEQARLERDGEGRLWRSFVASRRGESVRVAERIVGADPADAFTDASAWFWAAQLGRSHGPWQAITVATPWPSSKGDAS